MCRVRPSHTSPHYHAIIFGLSPTDLHLAITDWRKRFGFVRADLVDITTDKSRSNTARYIGKYCAKGVFENPLVSQNKVLPAFRLMSKGLGNSFVDKHKNRILNYRLSDSRIDDIKDKLIYNLGNCNYALPRYYKDKILPPKSALRIKIANHILAVNDEIYNTQLRTLSTQMSENQAVNFIHSEADYALRQRDAELKERQNKVQNKSKI